MSYLKGYTKKGIERVRSYMEKVQEERKRKNREEIKEGIRSIILVLEENKNLVTTFIRSPVEAYKTLRKKAEEKGANPIEFTKGIDYLKEKEELLTKLRPKERSKREKILIEKLGTFHEFMLNF